MTDTLRQDLVHAVRALGRARGFSVLVVLMLAVVISVTTTIFSLANTLLLRPAAGRDPEQLVRVYMNRGSNVHLAEYLDLKDAATTVDLAAFVDQRVSVGQGAATEAAFAEMLTGNYGSVIGIAPALGRMLQPQDEQPGAVPAAVLSDQYWQRRFGADPRVLGQPLLVNGVTFSVVGVMPESFQGAYELLTADLWLPLSLDPLLRPGSTSLTGRSASRGVQVIGRLRPNASIEAARTELRAIGDAMAVRYPETPASRRPSVYEAWLFPPEMRAPIAAFLGLLLAVASVLLVAACANVANVLLARGAVRARDMALRQAIGATRGRLIRQQLVEGLLLSGLAVTTALALTFWFTRAVGAVQLPLPQPVALRVAFDATVVSFAAGLALITTVLCSLAPALRGTRGHLLPSLRTAETTGSTRSRTRSIFVVAQVASSVLLLVVAGLFLRGLARATTIDLGMDPRHVLLVSFDTQTRGYTPERATAFYDALLDRIRQTPGVASAGLTNTVPLSLDNSAMGMTVSGAERPVQVTFSAVSSGTLSTLGVRLIEGRDFDARDAAASPSVAIINESLARRWFESRSAIGQRFTRPSFPGLPPVELEVVGVAADATYTRIGEEQDMYAYFPLAQMFSPAPTLMVRASNDALALTPAMREVFRGLDPALPVVAMRTLDSASSISLLPARIAAAVSGVLGALVLVLSTVGLYAVVAFMVRHRRREIGIRVAMGATGGDVIRLFLRQAATWTAVGATIGLALALALGRVISAMLFGVSPADPVTLVGVVLLMLTVTGVASYLPAKQAAALDPAHACRVE